MSSPHVTQPQQSGALGQTAIKCLYEQGKGSITVSVAEVVGTKRNPANGVNVELLDHGGTLVITAPTTKWGFRGFFGLDPGQYRVRVALDPTKLGATHGVQGAAEQAVIIVADGEASADFVLTRQAQPRVRLKRRRDGAGVEHVPVTLGGSACTDTDNQGISALTDANGILAGQHAVTFDLTGPQRHSYFLLKNDPIDVKPASADTFDFVAGERAHPKIKVVFHGTANGVPDISVVLDAVNPTGDASDKTDLGKTPAVTGLVEVAAATPGIMPGTYRVTLTIPDEVKDGYLLVNPAATIDVPDGGTATFTYEVRQIGALQVRVLRHDGKPLKGAAVTYKLTGPTPKNAQPLDTKIRELSIGDYEVDIDNLANVLTAQKDPLKVHEKWRIGPSKDGKAKLKVTPGKTAVAEFLLTKYEKIQFVAFDIKPTTETSKTGTKVYKGAKKSATDLRKRILVMKKAMDTAFKEGSIDHGEEVLKVFMAPEFYFRGREGAYPFEMIPDIMTSLGKTARDAKFKDWLFVYGTAIGYLKHGEDATHKEVHELAVTAQVGDVITVKDTTGFCQRIPAVQDLRFDWTVKQGLITSPVLACAPGAPGFFDLTLQGGTVIDTTQAIKLEEPVSTEILNVALVQKGGSGGSGLREAIIYKEYVSSVDFINTNYYGDRRLEVHGQTRTGIPTAGSKDILGTTAPNTSEINKSGLGGGSVFMVDGITFGLEVCLDHIYNKLYDFYANSAENGDPKVQVFLLPSWGMRLQRGPCSGLPNALLFNVDGPEGSEVAVLPNAVTFTCWRCGSVSNNPGTCATTHRWTCTTDTHKHEHIQPQATALPNCVHCGAALQQARLCAAALPAVHNELVLAGNCSVCGGAGVPANYWYCDQHDQRSTAAGNCVYGDPLAAVPTELEQDLNAVNPSGPAKQVSNVRGIFNSANQSDLFESKGAITVYPVKDVPQAEIV